MLREEYVNQAIEADETESNQPFEPEPKWYSQDEHGEIDIPKVKGGLPTSQNHKASRGTDPADTSQNQPIRRISKSVDKAAQCNNDCKGEFGGNDQPPIINCKKDEQVSAQKTTGTS